MERPQLEADVGVDASQLSLDNSVQQDLDVRRADEVKGGARSNVKDGTSNTLMVAERVK